jgi:hypothetical protein
LVFWTAFVVVAGSVDESLRHAATLEPALRDLLVPVGPAVETGTGTAGGDAGGGPSGPRGPGRTGRPRLAGGLVMTALADVHGCVVRLASTVQDRRTGQSRTAYRVRR